MSGGRTPRAGDRVSEYVLDERIGSGGCGEVWKAFHAHLPDVVAAVKIPTEPGWLDQLEREGALLHRLRGPHIVEVRGLDPRADPPYLVMEYVDGKSLRQVLAERRPIPPEDAAEIYRQALAALDAAHRAGVVHRDVKPENILIDAAGTVKLTDFGLGRCVDARGSELLQSVAGGPSTRAVAGTIRYMSPEQRAGLAVDARTDLYSLGLVLFEMLVGDTPQGAELPRDIRPALPAWADAVVSRCYTRLEKRYASAAEALEDIDRLVPRAAAPAVPAPDGPSGGGKGEGEKGGREDAGSGRLARLLGPDSADAMRPPPPGGGRAPAIVAVFVLVALFAVGFFVLVARTSKMKTEAKAAAVRAETTSNLAHARDALRLAYRDRNWSFVWGRLSERVRARLAEDYGYKGGDVVLHLDDGSILEKMMREVRPDDPPAALRALVQWPQGSPVTLQETGKDRITLFGGKASMDWVLESGTWKFDGPIESFPAGRGGGNGK
jgi:hypothetical protein